MFYVKSLDGLQLEPLINISDDFRMEQAVDGTFNVSFTCYAGIDNPGYSLLRTKSIINIENFEFVIEQYNDNGFSKNVTAISTFFNNSKVRKNEIFSGSHTLFNQVNFALSGTGWSFEIDSDISGIINYIDSLGEDNVVSLIQKIVNYHQVEYIILPENKLKFSKKLGANTDYQYRYKYNVSDTVLKEDTSNLYTLIRGYGQDDLSVVYRSPNADIFGELESDPVKDDRFNNAQALTDYIKNKILDVPELAIESSIPELTSRETGETVWFIYEPLNIEMETRILKQTKTLINERLVTSSVVFGNSLVKSSVDLLVDQKQQLDTTNGDLQSTKDDLNESKKEYRSRFDVTDNRITLEVEQIDASIAAIDIKADNINLSVNNRITNEIAQVDIRANQILLSVNDIDTRTSSSISQLSNNINLKIDKGGAITDINLSEGQATINANRINLNGAVVVNGTITGATDINVSNSAVIGTTLQVGQDSQASFPKAIRFAGQFGSAGIGYNNGSLTVSAVDSIFLDADNVVIRGELNGSINASSVNGVTITFSGKVATFRQFGAYIGTATLN